VLQCLFFKKIGAKQGQNQNKVTTHAPPALSIIKRNTFNGVEGVGVPNYKPSNIL